jgi:hypothetical protein
LRFSNAIFNASSSDRFLGRLRTRVECLIF